MMRIDYQVVSPVTPKTSPLGGLLTFMSYTFEIQYIYYITYGQFKKSWTDQNFSSSTPNQTPVF